VLASACGRMTLGERRCQARRTANRKVAMSALV
jgi:hypothetical protein